MILAPPGTVPFSVRPGILPAGPAIGPDELDLLLTAFERGRIALADRLVRRDAWNALLDGGLLNDAGYPTRAAEDHLRPMYGAHDAWTVTGREGGAASRLRLWIGADTTTVLADVGEQGVLDAVVPGEEASLVCAWAAVEPLEPGLPGPVDVPTDVFARRVAGAALDNAAGTRLGPMWHEPWFVWDVATLSGRRLAFINAGAAGHFAFGTVGEAPGSVEKSVRIVPVGSGEIWRALQGLAGTGRGPGRTVD